jgi:hypothetical protein
MSRGSLQLVLVAGGFVDESMQMDGEGRGHIERAAAAASLISLPPETACLPRCVCVVSVVQGASYASLSLLGMANAPLLLVPLQAAVNKVRGGGCVCAGAALLFKTAASAPCRLCLVFLNWMFCSTCSFYIRPTVQLLLPSEKLAG